MRKDIPMPMHEQQSQFQERQMWRGKPNCVCEELEWLRTYGGHVERLQNSRPSMKFAGPVKGTYQVRNAKREAMKHRIDNEIHEQNLKLLNKILRIDPVVRRDPEAKDAHKNMHNTSLNQGYRRKVEKRIYAENQCFLSRLQNVHSVYSSHKWSFDYLKHLSLRQSISRVKGTFREYQREVDRVRTQKLGSVIFFNRRPATAVAMRERSKRISMQLGKTCSLAESFAEGEEGEAKVLGATHLGIGMRRPQSVQGGRYVPRPQ